MLRLLLPALLLLVIAGCSTRNVMHGMYEGLRTRNDLQSSPSERAGKTESLNYMEYERIRQERLRE